MSSLHYGLTPKMKPIPPRRSALVAALDVGSSKVACLIARLRPHPPQQVLMRRSHVVEVLGFGHTGARGTKASTFRCFSARSCSISSREPQSSAPSPPSKRRESTYF